MVAVEIMDAAAESGVPAALLIVEIEDAASEAVIVVLEAYEVRFLDSLALGVGPVA